jgi:hypothetical protein
MSKDGRLTAGEPDRISESISRSKAGIPEAPLCASCGLALQEPFGWCSNCAAAYCLDCGRSHFCKDTCEAAGCIAGLCVRRVADGRLTLRWSSPPRT